jgi:hypothetical protein
MEKPPFDSKTKDMSETPVKEQPKAAPVTGPRGPLIEARLAKKSAK